ncbi:MAG: AlpA family phage regulatory protein [Gemmatimonadetes bacterium]|nr:AlpA family phage regulatory protein [Gemmatimonadota bacterium]MYA42595.1 AlpA family phage regulatory protein [Gemmatimonadota bacterium]MYE95192.1 AlpA family phage regulatory protein [Gemmatimonadota bacterium]MYJ09232.1 AlpA family phage regulatory protein [Gemmatimonadota bacterium]
MADRILRPRAVCDRLSISRTTLWRKQKDGDFPPALRLGPNSIGWRESTIQEWLDSRSEAAA